MADSRGSSTRVLWNSWSNKKRRWRVKEFHVLLRSGIRWSSTRLNGLRRSAVRQSRPGWVERGDSGGASASDLASGLLTLSDNLGQTSANIAKMSRAVTPWDTVRIRSESAVTTMVSHPQVERSKPFTQGL